MSPASVERLAERLAGAGAGDVVADPDVLETYRRDQAAPGLLAAGMPAVLARPRTTDEVAAAVRVAAQLEVPVVPRGAGSGLSGGANALDGCIVLSTERMNGVIEIAADSMLATVGPGLINGALKDAVSDVGLNYAPDPASFEFSTIGGNVATNAGGLCCVRHGVTRDALLGLEVVLADGRAVRLGGRTRKNVSGYDLVSLFCGSEGTLGIVTEVSVRLVPKPPPAFTLAASFPGLAAAGRAIVGIMRETEPLLLELMDRTTLEAVEAMQPMELEASTAALVFARTDRSRDLERMAGIADAAGADFVATSDEEAEGRMLMAARRLAYPALERKGRTLLDDVGVPIGRITDLLEGVQEIASAHELLIGTFGHAGEGNMHPTIVYPAGDEEASRAAVRAFEEIVELALSLGGTITGEHGVGLLKRKFLPRAAGPAESVHRTVKQALDPRGIFNPGKAI